MRDPLLEAFERWDGKGTPHGVKGEQISLAARIVHRDRYRTARRACAAWSNSPQAHGRATTGGRVSTTGVVGLTLGGGSGWLERKHGLACDNLVAVELVTADGQLVRASEDEHSDLFWALHGGGGNFGVATALEFGLHPVGPEVFVLLVAHRADRERELLEVFRDYAATAPEGAGTAFVRFTGADGDEMIPPELAGEPLVLLAGMYAGPVDEGEEALRPLREFGPPAIDASGPMPYTDFQCALDDAPGFRNYWTVEYLADMSDEVLDVIVDHSRRTPSGPSQTVIVRWGGAVARVGEDETPLAKRDATWSCTRSDCGTTRTTSRPQRPKGEPHESGTCLERPASVSSRVVALPFAPL